MTVTIITILIVSFLVWAVYRLKRNKPPRVWTQEEVVAYLKENPLKGQERYNFVMEHTLGVKNHDN